MFTHEELPQIATSSSAIFVSWKCMTLIFDISSACLWEAPFAQRLSQRNKGKELSKKTPLLEDVMYFYILRMNFHLFKNHMDVESLQKTGISRMVGYQVVGCVLFFQL